MSASNTDPGTGRWIDRFSLSGKRAVVTGASKGIGLEICSVFADAGADIVAVGRDEAGLAEVVDLIAARGRRGLAVAADMATAEGPRAAAAEALDYFGTVDILVNCAGVALIAPLLEAGVEDWDRTMAINLRAPFLLGQALAPGMIAQGAGKIINVSSQAGVIALDDHGAYSASKGGLNALTRAMMVEWAKHNVQVNVICPTIIMTPMGRQVWGDPDKGQPMLEKTPLGRFGEPVEVADLALYLASPASDLMNGAIVMLEGGYTSI
ncbi:glucose 1-dehydrogenase [Pelagibius litoralis]|uniref:Glucose 1-dehydrogenase n=1 Tax=Pelagibius litoralis TaxID=374515 RepID=A0A967EZ86_9PROT|nr:glucose 1-dehydrogenase [Pelagibius litoralis]NIA70188.1 glucose 1-dehydrogenase [Pelagibius litoralis]